MCTREVLELNMILLVGRTTESSSSYGKLERLIPDSRRRNEGTKSDGFYAQQATYDNRLIFGKEFTR